MIERDPAGGRARKDLRTPKAGQVGAGPEVASRGTNDIRTGKGRPESRKKHRPITHS